MLIWEFSFSQCEIKCLVLEQIFCILVYHRYLHREYDYRYILSFVRIITHFNNTWGNYAIIRILIPTSARSLTY